MRVSLIRFSFKRIYTIPLYDLRYAYEFGVQNDFYINVRISLRINTILKRRTEIYETVFLCKSTHTHGITL